MQGKHRHVVSLLLQPIKPGALAVFPTVQGSEGAIKTSETFGRRRFGEEKSSAEAGLAMDTELPQLCQG